MRGNAFHPDPAGGLSQAIVAFAQFARGHGLNVGLQETLDALEASRLGLLVRREGLRLSLRSLFCTCQEDLARFDRIFGLFWDTEAPPARSSRRIVNPAGVIRRQQGSLVMMGQGRSQESQDEEGKNVSGAHEMERLCRTDFSRVSDIDADQLEEIARRLWREMSLRLKRRWRKAHSRGRIDLRRTIRRSVSRGGDPMELVFQNRQPRKQRLVILLDVSGSMDKYSFFLLRFVCALQEYFSQVEAFTFSTSLQRISDYLRQHGLAATLRNLSDRAEGWSSGTRMGDCLQTFNDTYARRVLAGNSLVLILSDGLDTGEPEQLSAELQRIARRAKRLIWLNPLKGMSGYEPTARGMQAALPHVHAFHSAHNLNSLLELENILLHV